MDNAGNGRRGLRATISEELAEALRTHYGLDASDSRDLGGSANLNLLVEDKWLVRVYRPYVTAKRITDIQRVRRALADGGVPVAEVVPNHRDEYWTVVEGRVLEVERFVASDAQMNSWERLEAGMPTLGRIHGVLAGVPIDPSESPAFVNHIDAGESIEWTSRASARIRAWDPTPAERSFADLIDELAANVWEGERETLGLLPQQIVHGDFWDNNVLFRAGRLVLVTDFDFIGVRPRIDDVALTLYFSNAEFKGDRLSQERIGRLRRLVDAYDKGLPEPLSSAERAALPWAIARQPLWSAGKWLALLDSEEAARGLAAEMAFDVAWALGLVRDVRRWQAAFA